MSPQFSTNMFTALAAVQQDQTTAHFLFSHPLMAEDSKNKVDSRTREKHLRRK